jgi:Cu+-exporting ATPase
MSCANCALNIERNLKKLQGVEETNVNFAAEHASVAFDPGKVQVSDLVKMIEDAGYGIAVAKVELPNPQQKGSWSGAGFSQFCQ